jgi:hypothetical protein
MTRKYSSISVETTLASAISSIATTVTLATGSTASLLGGVTLGVGNIDQFTCAIDPDTVNEEIVFVTAVSSDTLTIVRGRAGTSAITHSGGATIKHVLTSNDLDYYTSGITNAVTLTGTETLTNKTISASNNTLTGVVTPTSTETMLNKVLTTPTITSPKTTRTVNAQTGTTYTLVAADQDAVVTLTNASAIALTVPSGIFSIGQEINLVQFGAGQVTVSGSGVTVVGTPGLKLRAQNSVATLICVAANSFVLVGDLSA